MGSKEGSGHIHGCEGDDCPEAFEKMSDLVDGELDSNTKSRVEEHFASCSLCLAVLRTFRKTLEIFRGKRPDDIPDNISSDLHKTIRAEIEKG